MPFHATLTQLIDVLGATAESLSDFTPTVTGITTDSRHVKPGEIFLALRGETFDGHEFVRKALEQGAIAAIVDSQFQSSDLPLLKVEDTLQAYQAIAHWWRHQFDIPVIAITGSVGKTTTKELMAGVLSKYGNVLKTQANYNNEIGVPKTLLELSQEHDYAVVEMGMRARGEIALLSRIASPTIAVITNVGTAHIGRLGSREAIAEAKCELLAEMPKDAIGFAKLQRIAILNHDNPLLIQTAQTVWHGKTLTYGLEGGDLHGQLTNPETLKVDDQSFPLPLLGQHNALNYLAALAVTKTLNLEWSALKGGLDIELPGGRSRKFELANDIVILDETYNAGLESMLAALQLLADTPGTRHIAVLGTMKELGDWSVPFHQQVGAMAKQLNLDGLLILADEAEAEALMVGAEALPSEKFSTHEAVVTRLKELVRSGDRLLFKASRSVRLDQAVEQFRSQFQ